MPSAYRASKHVHIPTNDPRLPADAPLSFGYARLSYNPQSEAVAGDSGKSESVEMQFELITGQLNAKGRRVVAIFFDDGISAWDIRRTRPGFELLIEAMTETERPWIGTRYADRLSRNPRDGGRLLMVGMMNKAVIVTGSGDIVDLGTRHGQTSMGFTNIMSNDYSNGISENVARTYRKRHSEGRIYKVPFGWRRAADGQHLEIDPIETAAIRRMADVVMHDGNMNELLYALADEGLLSKQGKVITAAAARAILTAPHTIGRIEVKGELLGVLPGPAPLDEATQKLVAATYGLRKRGPRASGRFPLTGLLVCECGYAMKGATFTRRHRVTGEVIGKVRRYVCGRNAASAGKCSNTIAADAVDAAVREGVLEWQARPENAGQLAAQSDVFAEDRAEIEALIAKRTEAGQVAMRSFDRGFMSSDELDQRQAVLAADIEALRAKLAGIDTDAHLASTSLDALGADYDDSEHEARQLMIKAAFVTPMAVGYATSSHGAGKAKGTVDLTRVSRRLR